MATAVVVDVAAPVPALVRDLQARVRMTYPLHDCLCRAYTHSPKSTGLRPLQLSL